jgi:hypothetical protein
MPDTTPSAIHRRPAARGVVERTQPERVHDRDRAGAHREDVAQDAADTRRSPLVRLDRGSGGCGSRCGSPRRSRRRRRRHPRPRPGPASTQGASVGNRRRWMRELLYEQCSDHITEYIASSATVGTRPRVSTMRSYSSPRSPSSWPSSRARSAVRVSSDGKVRSVTGRPSRRGGRGTSCGSGGGDPSRGHLPLPGSAGAGLGSERPMGTLETAACASTVTVRQAPAS